LGDAPGTLDEVSRRGRRADLVCRTLEELQPAIEMQGIHGQGKVLLHGLAVITARHEGHGRPEFTHALDVWLPIRDPLSEYGAEELIVTDGAVKSTHQALDHRVVDTRFRRECGRNLCTSFGCHALKDTVSVNLLASYGTLGVCD